MAGNPSNLDDARSQTDALKRRVANLREQHYEVVAGTTKAIARSYELLDRTRDLPGMGQAEPEPKAHRSEHRNGARR